MASDAWKAWAVPWKFPRSVAGKPAWRSAACTAFTASPRATPAARLNDSVTAGNWPWWLTSSGVVRGAKCVKALSGTWAPVDERT